MVHCKVVTNYLGYTYTKILPYIYILLEFSYIISEAFSVFSVVQFDNEQCVTKVTGGSTYGTCLTSTECVDRGGSKQGNCASGFGTCCFFK